MAVRHAPAVDAWTFLQQQQQQARVHGPPSPSHHAGPDPRHMYREYQQNATAGVEARHPAARDQYRDYVRAAACAPTGHLPQYEYAQQQHRSYRYQHLHQQRLAEQQHERYNEKQPVSTTAAMPRQEPPQQEHHHHQQQQPPQQDVQPEQPSINNLWSLIPGTLGRQGSSRLDDHNNVTAAGSNGATGGRAPPHSQQHLSRGANCNNDRWFAPDVHLPLSDIARRHRARALARLRARRRALSEAALIPGRTAPVKRHSSETTNEADSGSDGENEDDDAGGDSGGQQRHRSKVFVVEAAEGGLARVVSGGLTRGVSGGVVRAVSGGGSATDETTAGSGNEPADAAAAVVLDHNTDRGDKEGVSTAAGGGGCNGKAETAAARATSTTAASADNYAAAAASSGSSPAPAPNAAAADAPGGGKGGNGGSAASKVGDLFELMRNVTMSFGTGGGGDAVDGEENLARELGKPVKYRYRQEAARSRKRTRGRFVSEKAPAFVSITELMAQRRAERDRQQKEEATPVPVGAG